MSKKFLFAVFAAALLGACAPMFSGCDRLGRNFAKMKKGFRGGEAGKKTKADSEAEPDDAETVMRYRKAAEHGEAWAQFNLGVCYEDGRGVEKDSEQAIYWYRKAAEQGDPNAQRALGFCYMGRNRIEDAKTWFRRAAAQGDDTARSMLETLDKMDRQGGRLF